MIKTRFAVLFAAFSSICLHAADDSISSFQLETTDPVVLDLVSTEHEIVARNKDAYTVYVRAAKLDVFLFHYPSAIMLQKDIHTEVDQKFKEGGYRSFLEIQEDLNLWVQDYGEWAELRTYGESGRGLPLLSLVLGKGTEDAPQILLTAATHGDELITTEVLMRLTEELLRAAQSDSDQSESSERIQNFLSNNRIHIIPVISPDSFTQRRRYVGAVDPNRNFPWPQRDQINSIPSIKALRTYVKENAITKAMDFHAHGKLVMFPWAYTQSQLDGPQREHYEALAASMTEKNQYRYGQISRILYTAKGSSADYWHWKLGALSIAIELGRSKVPNANRIEKIVDEAREMTFRFIEGITAPQPR